LADTWLTPLLCCDWHWLRLAMVLTTQRSEAGD